MTGVVFLAVVPLVAYIAYLVFVAHALHRVQGDLTVNDVRRLAETVRPRRRDPGG